MENSTLGRIISVEKEIQQHLDLERVKALEWLENEKSTYERKLREEEEHIKQEFERKLGQAVTEAEASASALIDDARAAAATLENFDEKSLAQIVARYIGRVLPGSRP
jgi:hypothetical protein